MPHSREVALFMKHTELFAFRKGLPVAAVGRYFQLDFRKSRPVCVEPQFHGRQADGFTQVHSPKTSLPAHSPASIPSGRRRREPQKRPFRQNIPAHPSPN